MMKVRKLSDNSRTQHGSLVFFIGRYTSSSALFHMGADLDREIIRLVLFNEHMWDWHPIQEILCPLVRWHVRLDLRATKAKDTD